MNPTFYATPAMPCCGATARTFPDAETARQFAQAGRGRLPGRLDRLSHPGGPSYATGGPIPDHRPIGEQPVFTFLSRLFSSFGRLADSVNALADTTDAVNGRLRERLALEAPVDSPRVIEHHDAEADARPARNGKREKAS